MSFNKYNNISEIIKHQQESFEKIKKNNPVITLINLENWVDKSNNAKHEKLHNVPFAIKDNFSYKNEVNTLGSNLLINYTPNYNSTVVEKLINAGGVPIFKTNLDELAMGGDGLSSAYGKVINFQNEERIVGGSSSGSAYIVASGEVEFAIGSDTGDSVRKPASFMGIVGYKPTWGIVSRYGLSDFAPSLDTVGWLTRNVKQSAIIADILVDRDLKDATSIELDKKNFEKNLETNKKFKIGVVPQILNLIDEEHKEIRDVYLSTIEELKNQGHQIIEIEFDMKILSGSVFIYKIISSIESLSSNSNINGWLFGEDSNLDENNFIKRISQNRGENFLYEVKKRFSLANHFLNRDDEFKKAKQIRFLINKEVEEKTKEIDLLMFPTAIEFADKIKNITQSNENPTFSINNDYLLIGNITGRPSISVPCTRTSSQIGISVSGKCFNDLEVFQLAKILEDI